MRALTRTEAARLVRRARKASGGELHGLYLEVIGADFAGSVTEERARASIVEAVHELSGEGGPMQYEDPRPVDVADLVGEPAMPAAVADPQSTPAESPAPTAQQADSTPTTNEDKEQTMNAQAATNGSKKTARKPSIGNKKPAKAKPARAAKPTKELTILLRDPKVSYKDNGKVDTITGKCTWKEGGKYCNETRTIHAADAFQVRYCAEHKKAAARQAAADRRKQDAKH